MAKLIPSRNSSLAQMQAGEKRFSERLEQKLEDDYLLWYDVPIGPRQTRPDFVVFHPRRGLLVLEVKDWKQDTISAADKTQFTLITSQGAVRQHNPLLQARAYALEIKVMLERDPALRHPAGHRHEGHVIMPWAHGVVLSNISRKQFEDGNLQEVIPAHLVICRDEMVDTVDAETFQERLWAMFTQVFPCALTLPQIDRIRWHMFPELRVEWGEGQFGLPYGEDTDEKKVIAIPDLIRVMDTQQEQLARSLGDEHRIIHGVAGSGKTMILGYRAIHLARKLAKPILVLCYNKTLAARLDQLMGERGLSDKVQVYNFHKWCRKMLEAYHEPLPPEGEGFFEAMVERVMAAVEAGRIPRFQYGAVLIDEGHDFEPEWYQLIVQMVDPDTNALLVLYDDAQNIYGKADRAKFTWKSVGVQAQGRTTILRINYRNTLEILSVARRFAHELLDEREGDNDGVPLIAPESAGRRGAVPELIRTENANAELRTLIERLRSARERGRKLSDAAVIFRHKWEGEKIQQALQEAGIACRLADSIGKRSLYSAEDSVKLVSMHSSKGLEFPLVIIPYVGGMPKPDQDEALEARLLYVAMTRATEQLVLIHHEESVFTARIRGSINDIQQQLAPPQLSGAIS
ncbi:DEAD/DEAH box helicase [Dyella mobilis]|uniref:DNA 3'-5' helicase n=1 Tax=Dyella mobilis TaxID=1849582 RepID=A0ABS2KDB3_9GAMM|nr:nuclease-related domain-containing DEAD/DEAH box helicase [Dyella mobilis]MBM7129168.1 NERD domain-containing protein [Dyella mobilis]GLQ98462.1 DNA helicase [Dyella mobilis]